MDVIKLFFLLVFVTITSGCVTQDPIHISQFGKEKSVKTITYDSNLRTIVLVEKGKKIKFCSEPAPDSDESIQDGVSASIPSIKGNDQVGVSEGTGVGSLGGRNPAVLITREVLFRLCEMGINNGANFKDQAALFIRSLELIESISNSKMSQGTMTKSLSSESAWKYRGPSDKDTGTNESDQGPNNSSTSNDDSNNDDSDQSDDSDQGDDN